MALVFASSGSVRPRVGRRALRWASPRRRGLNLTEVLVATFIAVTGVVFVAAMIPIGMHQLGAAIRADRGSTAAHQGWAEAEVRGLLQFVDENGVAMLQTAGGVRVCPTVVQANCGVDSPGGSTVSRIADQFSAGGTGAFAIDPWAISVNSNIGCFPYDPAPSTMVKAGTAIPRLTVRARVRSGGAWSYGGALSGPVARRLFTSSDDPTFSLTRIDQLKRPERVTTGDPSVVERDQSGQIQGEYSWMYTVSPVTSAVGVSTTGMYSNASFVDRPIGTDMWEYHVSTVVFFRRPLPTTANPPIASHEEFLGNMQTNPITFLSPTGTTGAEAALGGGEATLNMSVGVNASPNAAPRPAVGDWIMVFRQVDGARFDRQRCYGGASDMNTLAPPTVARWYRIEAVDQLADASSGTVVLRVMLKGPDWDYSLFDASGTGGNVANFALCKRVVSVVERTVRLEY